MKNLRNFFLMLTLLFLSGIVTKSQAQTYTWTGTYDNKWSRPENWTGGSGIPGANSTVIIPNRPTDPIIFSGDVVTISELQVQSDAILTIGPGGLLNVTKKVSGSTNTCITNNGTIVNQGRINLTENGATTDPALQNNGVFQNDWDSNFSFSGELNIMDVSGNGINNVGTFTNFSNSDINISNTEGFNGIRIPSGLFVNNGNIIISEGNNVSGSYGLIVFGISATFTNGVNGVVDITTSRNGLSVRSGAILNNNGTIYLDGFNIDAITVNSDEIAIPDFNNNPGGIININQRFSSTCRVGILLTEAFFNNTGGRINIDGTVSRPIQVGEGSVFTNEAGGIINLAELTNNVGTDVIKIFDGSFVNNVCSGIINHSTQDQILVDDFANGIFINSGWIQSYCNINSRISNNIGSIVNYGSGTFIFNGSGNNPVIASDPFYTHVWIGEENSDWTNLCNWAAEALPDATSRVWIERMFNNYSNPTLADDAQIQALGISGVNTSSLTINSGVTLTVDGSPSVGVLVEGSLVNNGTLDIDNTVGAGLQISNDITLGGKTYIGKTGNVGGAGILTDVGATLEIGLCAEVYVYEPLTLNEELINKGLLFVNTTETHSGSVNNIGVVDFPVDRSGLTIINRDLLIEPFNMEGCSANDVLSFGGFNDFTPATTWYSDANHTMVLGTYDNGINSFDLSVSIVAGAVPIYFTVSGNGCTFNVETQYININEVPANNTLTWEGTFNNEWTEPCNWSPAIVPTANEDVLIPNQANDPIIRNGVMAAAKSLIVQPSAQLTIENGGRIDISNSDGDGVYNQGIITCEFNTFFFITDASGNGLYNASGGTMNNRGTLNITNPGGHGLVNNSGTFNNNQNGTIDISMNSAPIGKNGIELLAGNFSNNASNATIFSIVPNGKAIHINGGTLTNQGYITTIGDLTVAASGTLTTVVNGTGFTSYGQIVLNSEGAAYLDGTINATVNYTPNEGNRIPFINMANSVSGTFVSENLPSSWFTDYSVGSEVALKYCTSVFYADTDGDGYGDPAVSVPLCNAPSGYVLDNTDCDDNNADKFPGNPEICDGYDNNCDGTVDEGLNGLTYVGDVGFQDQSAIDAWPGCYTSISGSLFFFDGSSITDLSPLTNLTSVGGDLVISFCDALPDLDGLENITSLGGEIIISYNENLLNVDGLNGLSSVIGSLFFYNNSKLSNLDGLANITSIISEVIISSNPQLTDLDGFSNVTSVGDFLQITSNAGLSDCCGIHYLLETPGAVSNFILIDNNDTGCDSQAEVETDCGDADNDGYSVNDGDCDDSDPNLNPGIIEICNGIDDNCDGQIDEGFDQDNDGYTTCAGDCNDTDANVNPNPNCSGTTRTWTGHISTDWEEACNWSPNCVPTSNDNVIIPNVANDPVIAAPSMVSVKSVRVNAGGHLTVSSDASLTINFSTQYGLDNRGGTLTNEGTIVIDITGSIGIFNRSGSTFDNTGTIHIGQNGGLNNIGGAGIWNEAIFNHSGTLITIDNTQGGGSAIENANMGTFTNAGLLLIGRSGEAGNIGSSGISNGGTFKHNASEIGIDNAHDGIYNYAYGIFHNSATINIGLDEGELNISDVGITNLGSFYQFDGQINIDNTGRFAISNAAAGLFANLSIINIGQNDGVGGGIENTSTINHNAGQINIDNAGAPAGIYNDGGNFNNFAVLNIGQNSGPDNMASIGILNLSGADFSHNSSQINIDHIVNEGIQNAAGTTFYNYSTIVIGATGATGNAAVSNSGFFLNNTCAVVEIISDNVISNPGNFINRGLLIEHASGTSNISTNDGIVNNLNGGTFSIANNNEILVEATTASDCASISPAFGLGATVDFNILGVFTDADATQSAGTYDVASNTYTPTNSLTLSTYIFYARIEDPVGGCTNVVEWPVVNNASLVSCYLDNDGDTYGDPINSQVFCDVCGTGYVNDNTDCDDGDGDEFPDQVWYIDGDGDGYGGSSTTACTRPADGFLLNELSGNGTDDCDDSDGDEFPGQTWYVDGDNDGYRGGVVLIACERPAGYKTASEFINTTDVDCNDGDPAVFMNQTWFEDVDGDGYYSGNLLVSCNRPAGFKLAAELVNTTDIDCNDNDADEFPGQVWYIDSDGDSYGGSSTTSCERPTDGFLLNELMGNGTDDCDDNDANKFPNQTWYIDADGDNYGGSTTLACERPTYGFLLNELMGNGTDDCDDSDANEFPGQVWYIDADGDSYGGSTFNACVRPTNGFLLNELSGSGTDDCNDSDSSVNPAATEICDGIDNDCDGLTDSADPSFVDNTAPIVNCQNINRNLNLNGIVSITASEVYASGSDDCGTVNLVDVLPNTFDCGNIGANTVTLTVNDGNGNESSCTASVTVIDGIAPVTTCQDVTVDLDANGNVVITATQVNNGSSDNCSVVSTSLDVSSFSCVNVGANTVTLTVTDGSGNSNNCTATITVEDNVAPDAQCIPSALQVTLDANGEYTIDPNTLDDGSTDACGIQNLSASPTLLNCSNEGQNSITLTVADVNGNTASCTATVEVANFFSINSITETDETCAGMGDGSIIISATTGGGQIGYSIDDGASFQFNNAFYSLAPGTYNIVVKIFGINGLCEKTATATVDAGGQAQTWYRDMDGDGYSNGMTLIACTQPSGYYLASNLMATSGDCNDSDEIEFPGQIWYADNDGDGYTDGTTQLACSRPSGCKTASELASTTDIDCNDSDSTIHPFATEICNGIDDDCDGDIDENTMGGLTYNGNVAFYTQADVDAFSQCFSIINGNVMIQGASITNLSNLSGWEEITGNLTIQFNGITSMSGLDNLMAVGGTLTIYFNSTLTTLDGLDALTAVGGSLMMYYNFTLSDGCAIYNLINGGVSGSMSIFFNTVGCNSVAEINANCGPSSLVANPNNAQNASLGSTDMSIEKAEGTTSMEVFPNPAVNSSTVRFDRTINNGHLKVADIAGRVIFENPKIQMVSQIQLDIAGWKPGTYLLMVEVDGKNQLFERLIVIDN